MEIYNPDIHIHMRNTLGEENWDNKYKIGYWVWELEELPVSWLYAHNIYDEIWVPTKFIQESLQRYKIVSTVIPYYIEQSSNVRKSVSDECITFLLMFDLLSFAPRKNPFASIQAFLDCKYSDTEDVNLVIKLNNHHTDAKTTEKIYQMVESRKNIRVINESLSDEDVEELIDSVDAVISLHRAEGFGLVLAEAMSKGKIVVATNWSGNLEFMNEDNSCLVDYKLVNIKEDFGPYKKGMKWSEPSISHATSYINKIIEDMDFRNSLSDNAIEYIKNNLSKEKVASLIESAIGDI